MTYEAGLIRSSAGLKREGDEVGLDRQLTQFSIQIRQRILKQLAVAWILIFLQLLENSFARKLKRLSYPAPCRSFGTELNFRGRGLLNYLGLLSFDRLTLPAARHHSQSIARMSRIKVSSGVKRAGHGDCVLWIDSLIIMTA